jgi:TRAP-type mannitol/chloroaromatic compound transport system substrate-binding protein
MLDTIQGAVATMAEFVRRATDGNFDIQIFAAGEIVPPLQAAEAVAAGEVEACHTASGYSWGRDASWAVGTGLPFGLNARMTNAWFYHGGGNDLMNGFYATQGLLAWPCGNTGAQMGGWFRNEIATARDFRGLKMRIGGIAGRILETLGAVPQQLAGDEIAAALEKGEIDAAEWVGPYDDEKLGLWKVAPHYHYPGWWEGGAALHAMFNREAHDALPDAYKAALQAACQAATCDMLAAYDARNPEAIKRLVAAGAKLRPFGQEVLSACFDAAEALYAEISPSNPTFAALLDSQRGFKRDAYLWMQLSELNFDSFMMAQDNAGKL